MLQKDLCLNRKILPGNLFVAMYNYLKLVQRKEEEKLRILLTACQDQIAFVIVCEYISKYWKWKEKIL